MRFKTLAFALVICALALMPMMASAGQSTDMGYTQWSMASPGTINDVADLNTNTADANKWVLCLQGDKVIHQADLTYQLNGTYTVSLQNPWSDIVDTGFFVHYAKGYFEGMTETAYYDSGGPTVNIISSIAAMKGCLLSRTALTNYDQNTLGLQVASADCESCHAIVPKAPGSDIQMSCAPSHYITDRIDIAESTGGTVRELAVQAVNDGPNNDGVQTYIGAVCQFDVTRDTNQAVVSEVLRRTAPTSFVACMAVKKLAHHEALAA